MGAPDRMPQKKFHPAEPLSKHQNAVASLKFSGGSRDALASASADGSVKIHQLAGCQLSTELSGHKQGVSDIAWAQDSQYLASGSDDKSVKLWSTETAQEIITLSGHSSSIFCLCFNPQGSLLVSGSCDESLKMWDLRTGTCLRTLAAHAEPVTGVDFSCDGTCIVSSSYDGLLRLWDVGMGECLKTIFAEGNPPVSYVRFTPNGRFILSSSLDDTIRLWNVYSPSRCVKTYRGHKNHRFSVSSAFALTVDDGIKRVISGSEDGRLYIWELQSRAILQQTEAHKDAIISLASHPRQSVLASGGMNKDPSIRLWYLAETDVHSEE